MLTMRWANLSEEVFLWREVLLQFGGKPRPSFIVAWLRDRDAALHAELEGFALESSADYPGGSKFLVFMTKFMGLR